MKWKFRMCVLSLLASASLQLALEDPAGFLGKMAELGRTSDKKILSKIPPRIFLLFSPPKSRARRCIAVGELSKGIALIESEGRSSSRIDRHLARRTRERLEQLMAVLPESGATRRSATDHRILHVLTNSVPYTHSGYTVRSHSILKEQSAIGLSVQAVTRLAYPVVVGELPDSPRQVVDGVEYYRLLPATYPTSLLKRDELSVKMIVEQARVFGATILHTTTDFKNALIVSRAAEYLGIPWVYEIRGELESTWLSKQPQNLVKQAASSEFYQLAQIQETRCAKAANAVVTLSDITKQRFIDRGVASDKIHVIPNAIDQRELKRKFDRSTIRSELGLPETEVVGTVTSVVGYEGIDTLIRALQHLPNSVEALIVGEGAARRELEELTRNLGLDSRVHFVGRKPQAEIWKWYAALDVFVMPRKDLQVSRVVTPIKALTALALEIPVVASDLPALREATGELAEYVTPELPGALAEGIRSRLQDREHKQGSARWLASRTWTANAQRYRNLYDSL